MDEAHQQHADVLHHCAFRVFSSFEEYLEFFKQRAELKKRPPQYPVNAR
jgi:hypothetical protein